MQTRTCPNCGAANPADAAECFKCQLVLGEPTLPTRLITPNKVLGPEQSANFSTQIPNDMIGFVVTGHPPVLVKNEGRIFLGRYSSVDNPQFVDLTPYGASGLGVSRQHAMVSYMQGAFILQDLGSTNGTWVNDVRLMTYTGQPLKNGDTIRLAQLALFIYWGEQTNGNTRSKRMS
jgi:hypothetical protein